MEWPSPRLFEIKPQNISLPKTIHSPCFPCFCCCFSVSIRLLLITCLTWVRVVTCACILMFANACVCAGVCDCFEWSCQIRFSALEILLLLLLLTDPCLMSNISLHTANEQHFPGAVRCQTWTKNFLVSIRPRQISNRSEPFDTTCECNGTGKYNKLNTILLGYKDVTFSISSPWCHFPYPLFVFVLCCFFFFGEGLVVIPLQTIQVTLQYWSVTRMIVIFAYWFLVFQA